VQIHHIDDDPSNNMVENLAVLCFLCHHETQIQGGFSRTLTPDLVSRYRDDWHLKISRNRNEAIGLVEKVLKENPPNGGIKNEKYLKQFPSHTGLFEFVYALPKLRRLYFSAAKPGWESGITAEMIQASYFIVHALEHTLIDLARFYPATHFDEGFRNYFSSVITERFRWHRLHFSVVGDGYNGTIEGTMVAGAVISDLETMVEEMVSSLSYSIIDQSFEFLKWREEWRLSRHSGSDKVQ